MTKVQIKFLFLEYYHSLPTNLVAMWSKPDWLIIDIFFLISCEVELQQKFPLPNYVMFAF